jgi:hypothetical protein
MPSCPNCGRKTLRTLDWACQWCGYPLLSRAFKKIDKTFKELQEERAITSRPAPPEPEYEPEIEPEPRPVYEPASRPETALEPTVAPEPPATEPPPVAETPPVPEPEPETPPAPKTAKKGKKKAATKPKKKSQKKTKAAAEPVSEAEPVPEPMVTPSPATETEPTVTPPPAAETEPTVTPPPTPQKSESGPSPVVVPKLETLTDGDLLSVDGLDALFRENKMAAHAALTDKTVKVQGIVDKIFIRDHIDVRYIVLKGTQKKLLWPIRCSFGKEIITEMYRLSEGQEITVQGKYDGYGKNIIFKDCVIVN